MSSEQKEKKQTKTKKTKQKTTKSNTKTKKITNKTQNSEQKSVKNEQTKSKQTKKQTKVDEKQTKEQVKPTEQSKPQPKIHKPEFSNFLHVLKKFIILKFNMKKVPLQYIKFKPEAKKFHFDTLQWTKKYLLEQEYPKGVTVDPTQVEGSFEAGFFTVRLPVTHIPEDVMKRELEIVESKRKAKLIKFEPPTKKHVIDKQVAMMKKRERKKRKKERETYYDRLMEEKAKKQKVK